MTKARPRGWWYPWIFAAGFAVVFIVNGIMVYNAKQASTAGSVRGNPYEDGLRYNEVLAEAEAQKALGWHVTMRSEILTRNPDAPPTVRLYLTANDRDGRFLDDAVIDALLYRPIGADLDRPFSLTARNDRFEADIPLPAPGQWEARILIHSNGHTYRLHQRIFAR